MNTGNADTYRTARLICLKVWKKIVILSKNALICSPTSLNTQRHVTHKEKNAVALHNNNNNNNNNFIID
jgi:hypothetical protein